MNLKYYNTKYKYIIHNILEILLKMKKNILVGGTFL